MQLVNRFVLLLAVCLWTGLAFSAPLDINTATADEIAAGLTGIGKTKAAAIVQDREKNGPFKSVDDLSRVKGIGAKTIAKNRDKISVGGEPANPAESAAATPPTQPTSPPAAVPAPAVGAKSGAAAAIPAKVKPAPAMP